MFDIDAMILAPMMDAGVFGEDVRPVYMPQTGGAFAIDGVFDDGFTSVNLLDDGGPEFATNNPVLGVRLAQFPTGVDPQGGDRVRVVVRGVPTIFQVNNPKPDGKGWAKLELTLQGPAT